MKKKNAAELAVQAVFLICALASVGAVLGISIYLVLSGLPGISKIGFVNFISGKIWDAGKGQFGILPFILTSIYGTACAVTVSMPIGVLAALFISRAAPGRIADLIRTAVDLLAAIPSVVWGLVGMTVLVPTVQRIFDLPSGSCLFTAIIVLSLMILPYIISVTRAAIDAVPDDYEQASLALGATEYETYFKVTLRAASRGVLTAAVQAVGRSVGEATAVIMVSGNVARMPSLLGPVRFMTTAIVSEMSYASYGSMQRQALFSCGFVLFLFVMLINCLLELLRKRSV